MGYITPEYYLNEYKGVNAGAEAELEKYIMRASDLINQVTNYKLLEKDFELQPKFIQEQVRKAVATQVEFYVIQGGDMEVNAGTQDYGAVGIGSFNYTRGSTGQRSGVEIGSRDEQRISPNSLAYLRPTGLLYTGLGVIENAWY